MEQKGIGRINRQLEAVGYTGSVSFLDNLENSLKALESQEERDPEKRAQEKLARAAEREAALQLAPVVEALKSGEYTQKLLGAARTLGHKRRMFVDIAWIGTTLRLETRGQRLELRPTPAGVQAVDVSSGEDTRTEAVDLTSAPETLLEAWFARVEAQS